MRAVVDTNIFVSGLLRPDGPPGAVVLAIAERRLTPVVCQAAMVEYGEVLRRRAFRFAAADVDALLAVTAELAIWVEVPAYTGAPDLPDPADWPFLACALAAQCPVITGNVKHFPGRLGVVVMTAREWVDQAHA
jgi:putative PIN family toxin of toxin-antitoxin system